MLSSRSPSLFTISIAFFTPSSKLSAATFSIMLVFFTLNLNLCWPAYTYSSISSNSILLISVHPQLLFILLSLTNKVGTVMSALSPDVVSEERNTPADSMLGCVVRRILSVE